MQKGTENKLKVNFQCLSLIFFSLFSFFIFSSAIFKSSLSNWAEAQTLTLEETKKLSSEKKKIKKIFQRLHHPTKSQSYSVSDAKENLAKNRHNYFLPYNKNRTCRSVSGFYVSASDVVTDTQHYIISQAPLKHTVDDFFYALLERKSPLIVTLVMPQEAGEDKCYPFWKADKFPIVVNGWQVNPQEKDTLLFSKGRHRLVRRTFFCTHYLGKTHTITQLHYENWPDNGPPSQKLFTTLLKTVEQMNIAKETPITVHCSAGVGRSGTFVAAHSLRKKAVSTKVLNIPKTFLHLRKQRVYMIATHEQLRAVYRAVSE